MEKLIDEAYEKAREVIKECIGPFGLRASASGDTYINEVWARDAMIALIGASAAEDFDIKECFRKSLEILAQYQTDLGCIPNKVDCQNRTRDTKAPMDGNSWYVIGHYVFYQRYQDLPFLEKHYPSIQKALLWLRYQDSNDCGLLESQVAADWQDFLGIYGNSLTVNILYSQALSVAGKIARICHRPPFEVKYYQDFSQKVKDELNSRLWFEKRIPSHPILTTPTEKEAWEKEYQRSTAVLKDYFYYRPCISYLEYGDWFDSLGNLLAVIWDIAEQQKTGKILDYISELNLAELYPLLAIYPPIVSGDKYWHDYYASRGQNLPYHYQNGGIWPFIGGLYVAALVKTKRFKEAEENLMKLAQANRKGKKGEWEFNEWLQGITGEPMGAAKQAWSAGMYIYAYEVLKKGSTIF